MYSHVMQAISTGRSTFRGLGDMEPIGREHALYDHIHTALEPSSRSRIHNTKMGFPHEPCYSVSPSTQQSLNA